ncbi:GNAT family N-acetyltransferase [Kitasatospora sp. NPDC051914]|uniref:GNAT family N-acetyltransferase n=1 Tax=Kitasatospora sp. NPDC051914 TaxID=3154945 RepID=UPI003418A5DD
MGVARCGPTGWMVTGTEIPDLLRRPILRRINYVGELAVAPDHRNRGIARALLHQTEHDMCQAGYGALVLGHDRHLTRFYQRLGYTSARRLALDLAPWGHHVRSNRRWWHTVKPLAPEVSLRTVYGSPVLTGLLPG